MQLKPTLDFYPIRDNLNVMNNKAIAEDLLKRTPESCSLREISQEIEFVAAVRDGIEELDQMKGLPIESIEQDLPSWITH
jgi:hypothetical protein